jgi:hypothetical protein
MRADIVKTPGRLVFDPSGANVSLFSKLNTPIERMLVHEMFVVGTDNYGQLDWRDREAYARIRITPDGRLTTAIAAVLWPSTFRNYTAGHAIFANGTDVKMELHGIDGTKDVFTSVALETLPPLRFMATETAVGQAEFLCLRGDGKLWNDTESLVTEANTGGTMTDSLFTVPGILTGPYWLVWNAPPKPLAIATFETIEGITVEFQQEWSDDTRQSVGIQNRRIKSVNARVRCSPLGVNLYGSGDTVTNGMRSVLTAEVLQGGTISPGGVFAVRGRSIQNNSHDLEIWDVNGVVMFQLKNAALTEDKEAWSIDTVRETDLVWQGTRSFAAGVPGAIFDLPLA